MPAKTSTLPIALPSTPRVRSPLSRGCWPKAVPDKVRVAVGKASNTTCDRKKMLQNSGSYTKVVGGGQRCESIASKIKRSLRRENKMGRKRVKVSTQHVDSLATFWLSNKPGLLNAVKAVASYRKALQDKVPPQTAFLWTSRGWKSPRPERPANGTRQCVRAKFRRIFDARPVLPTQLLHW